MQKILFISIVLIATALWVSGYGAPVYGDTVGELIEGGKSLDGTEVTLQVEAIGDLMKRGGHAWVNGLDASGAIGLWLTASQASEIKMLGNGKFKGDILEIKGEFHRACQEHGGDMDIHVADIRILESGYATDHKPSSQKLLYAAILTSFTALIGLLFVKLKRKYL